MKSMDSYVCVFFLRKEIDEFLWILKKINGFLWILMDFLKENRWILMDFGEYLMESYGFRWNFNGILWISIDI